MTDKERYGFDVEREMRHLKGIVEKNDTLTISNRFTRYLIEQAERAQELEDIIYQDARQDVIEGLYEENKRYREGIKLAMKKTDCDNTWDFLGRLLEGKEETDLPYRIGYKEESE